jgi:hypothetical protein
VGVVPGIARLRQGLSRVSPLRPYRDYFNFVSHWRGSRSIVIFVM